mmetsp:Transcript_30177/g.41520  ORF Transcript_30177/g.41520 Transcript_30177/m.41520 type:complete len:475 (-) Transcript_30177:384-1808(-)
MANGFSTGDLLDIDAPPGFNRLPRNHSHSDNSRHLSLPSNHTSADRNGTIPSGRICVVDPIVPHLNICSRTKSALYPPKLTSQLPELLSKLMKSGLEDIQQHLQAIRSANEFDVSVMLPMCSEKANRRTAAHVDRSSPSSNHSFPNNYVDELHGSKASQLDNVTTAGMIRFEDYYPDSLHISVDFQTNRLERPRRSSVLCIQDEVCYLKSINAVERIIREAELVASTKITEESIIILVNQILEQFGALPIGEMGKELQIKTGNDDFPKLLKKGFSGLKKFIIAHPKLFRFGDNHNFNPVVYRVEPEKEMNLRSRTTPAGNPSLYSSRIYSSKENNTHSDLYYYPQPQQPFSIRVQSSTRQLDENNYLTASTQPSSHYMTTQQHSFFSPHLPFEQLKQTQPSLFSLSIAVAMKSLYRPSSQKASRQHSFQFSNDNSSSQQQQQSTSVSPSARVPLYHLASNEYMERQHFSRFGVH